MADDRQIFPARFMLQRKDGDRWVKLGNGANDTGPLTRRKMGLDVREEMLSPNGPRRQYRVYDRIDGCEVIEVPPVDASDESAEGKS